MAAVREARIAADLPCRKIFNQKGGGFYENDQR